MNREQPAGSWAVAVTFMVALMLVILPLPDWAVSWRPAWVTMVLIYWCLAVPQKVGMGVAWILGIMLDVMTGTLLGLHALSLTLTAFLTNRIYLQIRVRPLWQQSITVLILVLFASGLDLWMKGIAGLPTVDDSILLPALTSALLWPWVFVLLRDIRRRFKVN